MEKLPDTTLLRIFDFAFGQKKTGKKPVKYRKFFEVVATLGLHPKEHTEVLKLIYGEEKAKQKAKIRQGFFKTLQKQKDRINKTLQVVYGYKIVFIHNKFNKTWELVITDDFCKALEGKSDTELDAILESWQENFGESKNSSKIIKHSLKIEDQLQKVSNSKLIKRFYLRSNQIIARIHEEYALELDEKTISALDILNFQRQSQRLIDYYPGKRLRLICPPSTSNSKVMLDMAPMNYACFALLREPTVSKTTKKHIKNQIKDIASHIPQPLKTTHRNLNAYNFVPLGVQFVILTKDGRTLLRKRGKDVGVSSMNWSTSFGGYCCENDKWGIEFNIGRTARRELDNEIGSLAAGPLDIRLTGLHRNTQTGSINILGFWKLQDKTDKLVNFITDDYPGTMKVFKTTKKAYEPYVWDSENIIVNFQVSNISKALKKIKSLGIDLIPECFVALILALEASGQSTSELFQ